MKFKPIAVPTANVMATTSPMPKGLMRSSMLATHIQVVLDRAAGHQLVIARAAALQVFRMSDARNVGPGGDEQVRCIKNWSEWADATTVQPLDQSPAVNHSAG